MTDLYLRARFISTSTARAATAGYGCVVAAGVGEGSSFGTYTVCTCNTEGTRQRTAAAGWSPKRHFDFDTFDGVVGTRVYLFYLFFLFGLDVGTDHVRPRRAGRRPDFEFGASPAALARRAVLTGRTALAKGRRARCAPSTQHGQGRPTYGVTLLLPVGMLLGKGCRRRGFCKKTAVVSKGTGHRGGAGNVRPCAAFPFPW